MTKQRHARAAANCALAHASILPNAHENLRALLLKATAADVREGTTWYQDAHEFATELAATYSVTLRQASAVIAALSPQVSWELNKRIAVDLLDGGSAAGAFTLGIDRARRIIADPNVDPLTILGGHKVRSFYLNISRPNLYGPVTIDRHAVAILSDYNTSPAFLTAHPKHLEKYGAYHRAAGVYRTVARELNLAPHVLQAIAWVTWRRLDYVPEF